MAQTINTNMASLNAQRNLSASGESLATSVQRLSSGLRVNSAKDDAAGLAIAERFTSQIRGMNVAIRNANDGISLLQTAEGALAGISANLQRIRELAVQSANAINSLADHTALDEEAQALLGEVDRIGTKTTFNGIKLLDGTFVAQNIQSGANNGDTIQIPAILSGVGAGYTETGLGLGAISLTDTAGPPAVDAQTNSVAALGLVDTALDKVNSQRATFGALLNSLSSVITNLQNSAENHTASRSRIMDADFAAETANLSRAQVLQQAGMAMVAQANQIPQGVMALLRN